MLNVPGKRLGLCGIYCCQASENLTGRGQAHSWLSDAPLWQLLVFLAFWEIGSREDTFESGAVADFSGLKAFKLKADVYKLFSTGVGSLS